jgi:ADP-ribosylglycohydrolase
MACGCTHIPICYLAFICNVNIFTRFTQEYFKESSRGYGGSVATVFQTLKDSNYEDEFKPARDQFEGEGSYGNGGAMRICPAGLFAEKKNYDFSQLQVIYIYKFMLE